jgi:hypothetical protein
LQIHTRPSIVGRLRGLMLALTLLLAPLLGLISPSTVRAATNYTISNDRECAAFLAAIGAIGQPHSGQCYVYEGTLPAGDTLTLSGGWDLRPQGHPSYPGANFVNLGTITGPLYNAGIFENRGTFTFNGSRYIGGVIDNYGTIIVDGTFGLAGTINNYGVIEITCAGEIRGTGTIVGNPLVESSNCSYTISNDGECAAFLSAIGAIGQPHSGQCYVYEGTLPAGDTLTLSGGWDLRPQSMLAYPGTNFVNLGTITGPLYNAGTFENRGTFTFNGSRYIGGVIDNYGTIIVDGTFGLAGTINNYGVIEITCAGEIRGTGTIVGNPVRNTCPSADTTPPTANPSQNPAADADGWNSSDVTVTWNWADNDAGIGLDLASCTPSSTSSGEGALTLSATCADLSGNVGSASYTVKVDTTAPTISATATTQPNPAGWYTGDVTVTFSCNDVLSGVASCPSDQTLSGEGSAVNSTAQSAIDAAGNSSAPSNLVTVQIDTTAPTLNPTISPSMIRVGQSASASPNATDALSGVASASCDAIDTSTVGTKSVSCTATDNAGNSASASANYTVLPAFPTTAVLDTFDRANGSVGTNWDGLTGTSFYKIATNKLDVQLGGPLVWKATSFGTSQEAFVTLSTLDSKSPSQGVLLKVQTGSIPNAGAISVVYDAKAKAVRVSALRLGQNGAWTLYPNQAATFANGDVLGARAKADGTVQIYKNGTLLTTVTLNTADQQFFNAKGGKIGIWTAAAPNALLDDFGGGTVTP